MDKQRLGIILAIALLPFIAYSFRSDLIGADSYFYAMKTCGRDLNVFSEHVLLHDQLQNALFSVLPCDFFSIKIVLFGLYFLFLYFIAKTGETIDPNNGWLAGVFAGTLTQLPFFSFAQFENDVFGLVFFSAAIYFFIKQKSSGKLGLLPFVLVGIGGLFWKAGILLWFAFSLEALPMFLLGIFVVLWFGVGELANFLPSFVVQENSALVGIGLLGFLLLGAYQMTKKSQQTQTYARNALFLLVFGVLNAKYAIFSVPFLALACQNWYAKANDKQRLALLLVACVMFAWIAPKLFDENAFPTQTEWQAVDIALSYGQPLQNDWDLGYLIAWQGGKPSAWAGGAYNNFSKQGIVLTRFEMDCRVLEHIGDYYVYSCD